MATTTTTTTTTATTPKIRWKKLRSGSWGIIGPVDEVVTGKVVMVTARDGRQTLVHVDKVLWNNEELAIANCSKLDAYRPYQAAYTWTCEDGHARRVPGCYFCDHQIGS